MSDRHPTLLAQQWRACTEDLNLGTAWNFGFEAMYSLLARKDKVFQPRVGSPLLADGLPWVNGQNHFHSL